MMLLYQRQYLNTLLAEVNPISNNQLKMHRQTHREKTPARFDLEDQGQPTAPPPKAVTLQGYG